MSNCKFSTAMDEINNNSNDDDDDDDDDDNKLCHTY
jgi:hypothetical protein